MASQVTKCIKNWHMKLWTKPNITSKLDLDNRGIRGLFMLWIKKDNAGIRDKIIENISALFEPMKIIENK